MTVPTVLKPILRSQSISDLGLVDPYFRPMLMFSLLVALLSSL